MERSPFWHFNKGTIPLLEGSSEDSEDLEAIKIKIKSANVNIVTICNIFNINTLKHYQL